MMQSKRPFLAVSLGLALALGGCSKAPAPSNGAFAQALKAGQLRSAESHMATIFEAGAADEETQRLKLDLTLKLGDGYAAMAAIDALPDSVLGEAERRVAKAHAYLLQDNPQAAADLYDGMDPEEFSEQ
ncbi:MAG: hypothetical protein HRT64_09820, partial [Erythrobacter sp.]|nr:hypothetical protein [Erythrobacter sp.]